MTQGSDALPDLRATAAVAGVKVTVWAAPQSISILAGEYRLHYLEWGRRNARPIVFLHGGGLSAHSFDMVCLVLQRTYRCIALDLRGHGDSEWSPEMDYSLESIATDVSHVLSSLKLKHVVLVGMSLGALTALEFCKDHEDLLRGLVIVDTAPLVARAGSDHIIRFMNEQPQAFDSIDDFVERTLAFNPRRDPTLLRRNARHNLRQLPNGQWMWKYDRRHYATFDWEAFTHQRERLWDVIDSLTVPTLVVRGAESQVLTEDVAREMVTRLHNSSFVEIAGAGHSVQGDNPAALISVLEDYLAELPG